MKTSPKKLNYVYLENKLDDLQAQLMRLANVNFKIHRTSCFTELTAILENVQPACVKSCMQNLNCYSVLPLPSKNGSSWKAYHSLVAPNSICMPPHLLLTTPGKAHLINEASLCCNQ